MDDRAPVYFWVGQEPDKTVVLAHACAGPSEGGWHTFEIDAAFSGIGANFNAETRLETLREFHGQLELMYRTLRGIAVLSFMEGEVSIHAALDKFGHVRWDIQLYIRAGEEDGTFSLQLHEDQTLLYNAVATMGYVIAEAKACEGVAAPA